MAFLVTGGNGNGHVVSYIGILFKKQTKEPLSILLMQGISRMLKNHLTEKSLYPG
ncbi:MAG: hypothetical protein JXC36_06195 [Candidatus Atribacteria bacterium]|nr:hypothetical protein [Candidatus Atribacteria bacterium]